jgi:anti-sigma B factor antagonist
MTEVAHNAYTPGELEIQRAADGQRVVIALFGDLDLASAPRLERELHEIRATQAGAVLIDLGGLEFLDSSGISLLMRAQATAEADGWRLALGRGSEHVQKLFRLTGLLDHFAFER